jgi:myo-inositol 2-dehydrogenase/D-chiro-inositol 1-dehydrogenase
MDGGHVRIAVIGAGRMGAIRAEDLQADARVDEVLIANRHEGRAAELAARLGASHLPWSQAARVDVDGTVVAVATDMHATLLPAVIDGCRPVLCEKPIALTLAATQEVIDRARARGTTLQVGFQRRYDPGIRMVHARMPELGSVYSLSLISHDVSPSGREFISGSGGIFRDLHVHDFDLVRWLTGEEVDQVFATKAVRAHPDYADFDDADVTAIHAVTTGGVQVVVRGARHDALGHDVRLEAHGSADSVTAGLTSRTPLRPLDGQIRINEEPYLGFVDRFREAFREETRAFVDLVVDGGPNPCPPEAALESLRIAIACEESVRSRAPVRIADITTTDR